MEKSKRFVAPEAAIRLWFWLFAAAALIAATTSPEMPASTTGAEAAGAAGAGTGIFR